MQIDKLYDGHEVEVLQVLDDVAMVIGTDPKGSKPYLVLRDKLTGQKFETVAEIFSNIVTIKQLLYDLQNKHNLNILASLEDLEKIEDQMTRLRNSIKYKAEEIYQQEQNVQNLRMNKI